MNVVESLGLLLRQASHFHSADLEAGLLDHGKDLSGMAGRYSVRFYDGKSLFDWHGKTEFDVTRASG
jgi:hypothetical protein